MWCPSRERRRGCGRCPPPAESARVPVAVLPGVRRSLRRRVEHQREPRPGGGPVPVSPCKQHEAVVAGTVDVRRRVPAGHVVRQGRFRLGGAAAVGTGGADHVHPVGRAAPGREVDAVAAAVPHDLRRPDLAEATRDRPDLPRGRVQGRRGGRLPYDGASAGRLRGDVRATDPEDARVRGARAGPVRRAGPADVRVGATARTPDGTEPRDPAGRRGSPLVPWGSPAIASRHLHAEVYIDEIRSHGIVTGGGCVKRAGGPVAAGRTVSTPRESEL